MAQIHTRRKFLKSAAVAAGAAIVPATASASAAASPLPPAAALRVAHDLAARPAEVPGYLCTALQALSVAADAAREMDAALKIKPNANTTRVDAVELLSVLEIQTAVLQSLAGRDDGPIDEDVRDAAAHKHRYARNVRGKERAFKALAVACNVLKSAIDCYFDAEPDANEDNPPANQEYRLLAGVYWTLYSACSLQECEMCGDVYGDFDPRPLFQDEEVYRRHLAELRKQDEERNRRHAKKLLGIAD